MSLTAPGCGMGQVLMDDVKRKVEQISKVNASVELTFDPPWTPERMSEEARLTTGLM
jgi:metal-sulfur cluster biosynthetic enzyme